MINQIRFSYFIMYILHIYRLLKTYKEFDKKNNKLDLIALRW